MESRIVWQGYPVTVAIAVVVFVTVAVTSVPVVEGGKLGTLIKRAGDIEKITMVLAVLDKLKSALNVLRTDISSMKEFADGKKNPKQRRQDTSINYRPMLKSFS